MPPAALQRRQGQTCTLSPDFFVIPPPRHAAIGAPSAKHGGDGRDRTDDLMLAKQLLSQLSYVP